MISDILQEPSSFFDGEMHLGGSVKDIVSNERLTCLLMTDSTGEIPVLSRSRDVDVGQTIRIKGSIREVSAVGGQRAFVLFERGALIPDQRVLVRMLGDLMPFPLVAVSEVVKNAYSYVGNELYVTGTVSRRASFFSYGGFTIADSGAEVAVVSSRGTPKIGQLIRVRGTVHELVAWNDFQVLYLLEQGSEIPVKAILVEILRQLVFPF